MFHSAHLSIGKKHAFAAIALLALACSDPRGGRLSIRVVDGAGGAPLPARLELLDAAGKAWIPPEALPLRFECAAAPLPDWAAGYLSVSDRIPNRPAGTDQFYLDGEGEIELPPGRYRLRAFGGIEVTVAEREVEIEAGNAVDVQIPLERWADMAAEGWWSVDDHIHITRRTPEEDRIIGAWMKAEDLRVANLLQMGTVDQVGVTPQHDFGAAGEFRRGDTLLLAGQEHPRTHFLGHTITLGTDSLVDRRDTYIVYETTFRDGQELGGVSGYAHFGIGPARTGLTLAASRGLVSFLEVLQFDFPWYREWYDLLDVGIRMTPTAGTDFPCLGADLPGRERFYVQLDAPPTRAAFVEAVRAGRTFVTNGPLLSLRVGEAGIGDEIRLEAPGRRQLTARVRFDPERDDVQLIELVANGEVRRLEPETVAPGELRIETEVELVEPGWLALRVWGDKVGETPLPPGPGDVGVWLLNKAFDFQEGIRLGEEFYASRDRVRPSAAHTAAIYVRFPDRPATARAVERAKEAMARLDDLERRLADDRIADQTLWDWVPYSDAVPEEHLRRNRPALLRAIAQARSLYAEIAESR